MIGDQKYAETWGRTEISQRVVLLEDLSEARHRHPNEWGGWPVSELVMLDYGDLPHDLKAGLVLAWTAERGFLLEEYLRLAMPRSAAGWEEDMG